MAGSRGVVFWNPLACGAASPSLTVVPASAVAALSPSSSTLFRSAKSEMGNTASGATEATSSTEITEQAPPPDTKPKKKICCACPDTKKLRDKCIVQHGEDACGKWIEAHRQCLRAEGFNV